jgi:hypothetical protein
MAESMDLDQLQAWLQQTSDMTWACMLALNAGFSGMTLSAYIASLPRSPAGLAPGSLWVNAASNNLNWVP